MRVYETAAQPVRWHRTQKEAGEAARGAGTFRAVDVDTSHAGLVRFLNELGSAPTDAGVTPELPFDEPAPRPAVGQASADEIRFGPNLWRLWTLAQARFRVPSQASLADRLAAIDRYIDETRAVFGYADD